MWKRKREELEKSRGEEELLKRSRKEESLQIKRIEGKKIIEEWMKEMGDKFSRMIEEFREGFKSQERILNEMMEEMRRNFRK